MKNSKQIKQRGFAIPLLIAIIALLVIGGGAYYYKTKKAEAPTQSQNQTQNQNKNLVGNDKDVHGCIGSAGYSWCEAKQKCLRSWEEKCEAVTTATDVTIDMSEWKTYSVNNNKFGFSFKYPSNWKVTSGLGGIMVYESNQDINSDKSLLNAINDGVIIFTPKDATKDEYDRSLAIKKNNPSFKVENVNLGNYSAVKLTGGNTTTYSIYRNDVSYLIGFEAKTPLTPIAQKHFKIFNKVLGTFSVK